MLQQSSCACSWRKSIFRFKATLTSGISLNFPSAIVAYLSDIPLRSTTETMVSSDGRNSLLGGGVDGKKRLLRHPSIGCQQSREPILYDHCLFGVKRKNACDLITQHTRRHKTFYEQKPWQPTFDFFLVHYLVEDVFTSKLCNFDLYGHPAHLPWPLLSLELFNKRRRTVQFMASRCYNFDRQW